mmetsp:Transcript_34166/g.109693  ORF Transcript_34166/g.109693 Transcript_34166/m.109693 type:complete len:139 (-) Transcript_34166:10-426(-)
MAAHLCRRVPTHLARGKSMKTQLRLSSWRFECGAPRETCPRCGCGADSAEHVVFECPHVAPQERATFLSAMSQLRPGFQALSSADQLNTVLAPDAPEEWDVPLYSFLKKVAAVTAAQASAQEKKKQKKQKKPVPVRAP